MPKTKDSLIDERYTTLTALIVDDHIPMQKVIKSLLTTLGFFKIFIASNGVDALSIIKLHNIDLIVSDWNMPRMHGLELLQTVRAEINTANIPFIMLTANIDQENVKQAILSGVSAYIIKPFNMNSLKRNINRAFSSPIPKKPLIDATKKSALDVTDSTEHIKLNKSNNSILIVDDEPNNITVLTELLKEKYTLQACLSGVKALAICNQEQLPDLILLDIMMPEMDGLTVCQHLKNNPLTEHIPIIFISALTQTKDVVKGLSIGAADYITKPISPEITLARINIHMKQVLQREEVALQLETMIENMRLKEDIERIIHHDLKNPLAVIISAADTLKQQKAYSKEEVSLITESAETIKEMIDEQMLIHQLENNSTERELLPINALELFNKVVYGQKDKCQINNILVQYKIAKSIKFFGNQLLCFNLFNNLLANAIEASPANGNVNITIEQEQSSDVIIFNISNQGMIPEKIQARFFDKFITEGKENGTGLGTYSAKLSALAQGGDVSFSSTEENGTTLTVTLKAMPS
ncbi:response regulator [Colwellia demingiae]|uniref:histidine kinase n=1 Tax=Colwellia demingiae TaxID=89401 RepID=A0A5C6Q3K8_9GAMM|nr:response regulator [Colwellia demingiae]TWX63426.1 response regulator [Colwellia demingiae]